VEDLMASPEDGRIKLLVTSLGLKYRRENSDLFESGSYHPIEATGPGRQHVVAFARKLDGKVAIAVAGRFFLKLTAEWPPVAAKAWDGTALVLPHSVRSPEYVDVLAGHVIRAERRGSGWALPAADIFMHLPIALLESRG
jgi:(1->4)-alpha-D-glucan 1-alpha-D-glucosylmutase